MRVVVLLGLILVSGDKVNVSPRMSMAALNVRGPAHLCPTGPHEAFTARHVATVRTSIMNPLELVAIPVWFNDGIATATKWDVVLDIARLETEDTFAYYFPFAEKEAKVGDKVTVTGYNFAKNASQVVLETKVENFLPGTMVLKSTPGEGSSGSCVLNSDGEVVGINFGFIAEGGKEIGFAVVTKPKLIESLRASKLSEETRGH